MAISALLLDNVNLVRKHGFFNEKKGLCKIGPPAIVNSQYKILRMTSIFTRLVENTSGKLIHAFHMRGIGAKQIKRIINCVFYCYNSQKCYFM